MFKLDLGKAEEPEISLPTSLDGSSKNQESSRKTSISALLIIPKTLCGSQQTVENSKRGIPDHLTCLLVNLYAGQKATVRIGHNSSRITDWNKSLE